MAAQSQSKQTASPRTRTAEATQAAAPGSAEQQRNLRAQGLSGNAAVSDAVGLSAQGEGVDAMALLHGDDAEKASGPNDVVGAKDIPGVLYANTSETNLNKSAGWMGRLGFNLGKAYEATVTLDDLILAGHQIRAPKAAEVGNVQVPDGAKKTDVREYDYIETPTGSVVETGANRFAMRGGAGGVGEPVTLRFANNGALNLARLARSAYELAVAKGVTIHGDTVDYHGQTFALGCTVQMGNDVDAEGARAYGYVGEFDLKWVAEKVRTTVETVCEAVAVAIGKGQANRGDGGLLHPNHENAAMFQTDYHATVAAPDGKPVLQRKSGVDPITSKDFNDPTVQGWGAGADQQAWITDPATLAAQAQRRLSGAWVPGHDWAGHPSYITECPDFSEVLTEGFGACGKGAGSAETLAPPLLAMIKQIGAMLQGAPMDHAMIDDPQLLGRLEASNKKILAEAFARVSVSDVKTALAGLGTAQRQPTLKAGDTPVKGESPNGEGLVVLRDWSSRD